MVDSLVIAAVARGDVYAEEKFGVASWTVARRVRLAGIRRHRSHRRATRNDRIRQLRGAGAKVTELGEAFGLHPSRISQIAHSE